MLLPVAILASVTLQSALQTNLNAIIEPESRAGTLMGVYVCKTTGEELYSHLANTRLVPASNQKIVSSVFALDRLGADFRFQTKFWRDGENVYIDAPGDLTITAEQLFAAKESLGVAGAGIVYVKQRYRYDSGPSWEKDDLPFRYAPQITSLCVNRAQFTVLNSGGIPTVPSWTNIRIRHIPGPKPASSSLNIEKREVTVRGRIDPNAASLGAFSLPDPDRTAAGIFGRIFVATDSTPSRVPDYVILSPRLSDIAKFCLEPSDNLLAESLMFAGSGAGTYSESQRILVDHHIKTSRIPAGSLRPEDGSGMSRHNLVTPFALAQLLRHVYSQPYRDDYIRALPAAGEGTLGSRLAGVNVTAKTGTLDSVSCLSGYLWPAAGEPVVFSIMMNHYVSSASQARKVQDEIVQAILKSLNDLRNENGSDYWSDSLEENVPNKGAFRPHYNWFY